MASLSEMAKAFKNKVIGEASAFKDALKGTASQYGTGKGFIGDLGAVGAKAIVGATDVIGGAYDVATGDFAKGGKQIKEGASSIGEVATLKPVANIVSEVAGPGVISSATQGAASFLDPYTNIVGNIGGAVEKTATGDKIGGAIDLGKSILSALPMAKIGTMIGGTIAGGLMGGTGFNEYTQKQTDGYLTKRTSDLIKEGYNETDATTRANNEVGGINLLIMGLAQAAGGLKLGGKSAVGNQKASDIIKGSTKAEKAAFKSSPEMKQSLIQAQSKNATLGDVIKHNLKYGSQSAGIQSMEGDILKYISGSNESPEAKEYATLFATNLATNLVPGSFGGSKGKATSKGKLSQLAEENASQTKMDITPNEKLLVDTIKNTSRTDMELFKGLKDNHRNNYISENTVLNEYNLILNTTKNAKLKSDISKELDYINNSKVDSRGFVLNSKGFFEPPKPVVPKGVDETVADYKPVEKASLESSLVVPSSNKLLSDLAKESDTALTAIKEEPVKDTALETTEQITLGDEGAEAVPRETSPKVSQELTTTAPDITPPGGNAPGGGTLRQAAEQNVIEKPTIEMKQGGLEKARGFINSNINFQGFLNNLALKDKNGNAISADSYLEQSRSVANNVARTIISPLEEFILTISKNTKSGIPKVSLKAEDLIGGVTPEGVAITKDNYKKVYDTYNNIDGQQIGQKHTILEDNPRIQTQKKSFIYDLLKEDPKKLEKYLTPEEVTAFQKIDELETQTYSKDAQDLVDAGYLKDIDVANEYIRYVMGRKNYDRAIKDMGIKDEGFIVPLRSGGAKKFDTLEDLMKYYRYQDSITKKGGVSDIRPDEGNLASVLKEKAGEGFEPYRTHGAVNRLMSYADSVGNLYGDQFKSNLFDDLASSKDPKVQAYIKNLFTSPNHQNIIQEAYGIKEAPGIQEKASRLGVMAAIAGNVKSFTSALIGSPIKAFSVVGTNLYRNPQKLDSIAAGIRGSIFKSKEVKNTLASEGFTTGYELAEGGGMMNDAISFSSGTPAENLGKSVIAMNGMHRALTQNGYNPGSTPETITRTWQQFKKEKPSEYLGAHESILKDTRFVADVTDSARLQIGWGRKLLAPIKTYAVQQTKTAVDDLIDSATLAFKRKPGYENINENALKRTIARAITMGIGYVGAQVLIDKNDEALEDYLEGEVNAQFGYDPIALGKSAFGLNAIASVPLNFISDVAQTSADALQGRTDLAGRTLLKGLNQNLAVVRSLDNATREVTGKSFSEWIAGYDPNNLTERGISKGNEYSDDTVMKIFRGVGFNENYWEEQFARENLDEIIPAEWKPSKMLGMQFNPPTALDIVKMLPVAGSFVKPIEDIQGNLESFNQRSQGIDAMNTAKQIDGTKDIDEALGRVDLEEKDKNAIKMKLMEKMNGYITDNTNIKLSLKKEFLDFVNKGTAMDLDRLKEVNPVIYNDFVSILSQAQASDNPSNAIKNWKQASAQEQALIAQYNKMIPLETSLSNEVGKRITSALGKIKEGMSYDAVGNPELTPEGKAQVDEALGKMDKMSEFFVRMKDDMATHENGVALHATDISEYLKDIQMLQLGGSLPMNYLDGFPFLRTLIKNGIQLKGEQVTPTKTGIDIAQQASVPQGPAKTGLSALAASSAFGQKKPDWENLEYKERKGEPLIKSTRPITLSEMMKSQSKKQPMKSSKMK